MMGVIATATKIFMDAGFDGYDLVHAIEKIENAVSRTAKNPEPLVVRGPERRQNSSQRTGGPQSAVSNLYFIIDCNRTAVKIGLSANPGQRVIDLAAGSPVPLILYRVVPNVPRSIECDLHQHFFADWRHREWFNFSPAIDELITDVDRNGPDALLKIPPAPYPQGARVAGGRILTNEDALRFLRDGVVRQL